MPVKGRPYLFFKEEAAVPRTIYRGYLPRRPTKSARAVPFLAAPSS